MKPKNLIDESIKLQLEAKALGLDWIELDKIISKIREETDELEEAIDMENKAHIKEELGDLFFSLISLSRHLNIDIDDLNKSANDKFKSRLDKIKEEMNKRNIKYAEPSEMIDFWKSIKNKYDYLLMNKSERAIAVKKILDKTYPETPVPLDHKDNFSLLDNTF